MRLYAIIADFWRANGYAPSDDFENLRAQPE
jgi:hypothetical protein